MLSTLAIVLAVAQGQAKVGPKPNGGALLNTGQLLSPYGRTLEFKGRPVDMRILPDGTAAIKNMNSLEILDLAGFSVKQSAPIPNGISPTGMAVSKDGRSIYLTTAANELVEYDLGAGGQWSKKHSITLPGPKGPKDASFPCGLALSDHGRTAYVCLSRNNTLGVVDLPSGALKGEIPTGIAPFEVVLANGKAFVSNQGGRRPNPGESVSDSAGTDVLVDSRGIATTGTVTVVDLDSKETKDVAVGLQPCALAKTLDSQYVFVANANGDSISTIDASSLAVTTTVVKPSDKLPFGSMPDGLSVSADGSRLYVALAGNNAVAVLDIRRPDAPRALGFIPAGWYPVAAQEAGGQLLVLNNKGTGQRLSFRPDEKGMNSHDTAGGVQLFPVPRGRELMNLSRAVYDLRNAPVMLRAYEAGQISAEPAPVPNKLGEPSLIKHVVYVIKENRSYDQIFGDLGRGDDDPKLCVFGEKITPNEHKLARQFVTLDNYYCNGVLSADGHSWATEGNVTPYLNRAFGGFNRSYTFGNDPITYSSSGFIWDGILAAGLSFRNYGEMWSAELPKGVSAKELRAGYRRGKTFDVPQTTGIDTIKRYSCPDYPGWDLDIPDQYRIDRFMSEFEEDKRSGQFPNFVIVYLPQDHTGGPLGPAVDVADNDYAVGRLVDAISHSPFWRDTAIFINEDDPQAGFDHVDRHRSLCLVVSPYTQTGQVVSDFYNQCSVLHTIQQVFAIAPLNQKVAAAPLMSACFSTKPNMTPYSAVLPTVGQSELLPGTHASGQTSADLSRVVEFRDSISAVDLREHEVDRTDQMDLLNRAIWRFMKPGKPYPAKYAGAHGRGLAGKSLKLGSSDN